MSYCGGVGVDQNQDSKSEGHTSEAGAGAFAPLAESAGTESDGNRANCGLTKEDQSKWTMLPTRSATNEFWSVDLALVTTCTALYKSRPVAESKEFEAATTTVVDGWDPRLPCQCWQYGRFGRILKFYLDALLPVSQVSAFVRDHAFSSMTFV
ncbi:hypothetical protein EI94DRAFT_1697295 [Lactarius quietus]|nr:hypothetical protein EI94DRAFT_1697295 [Lactarius quietus]